MPVIPATQEAEIGRITVKGQPGQKARNPFRQNNPDVVVHTCNSSYAGRIGRRIAAQSLPGEKKHKTLSKQ
jgi:hypothetical protein